MTINHYPAPNQNTSTHNKPDTILSRIGMIVAFSCMVIAAWYLRPSNLLPEAIIGLQIAIIGICIIGIQSLLKQSTNIDSTTTVHARVPKIRWQIVGIGVVLLSILIHTNLPFSQTHEIPILINLAFLSPHLQFLLLVAGTGLIAWGLGGGQSDTFNIQFKRHHIYLLIIITIGFVLRVYHLETGIHRFIDESHFLVPIVDLHYGFTEPQLLTQFGGITAFSWIFPYWQSIGTVFWGSNLTGLRIISAIIGTLTIPATYVLAKSLLNQRTALLAALIIATYPPNLQFSRIGINNIADPLFGALAFVWLIRGLRSGRQMSFALAGLMFGYTHYFYEGGRLFYASFAIIWILGLLFVSKLVISRRNLLVVCTSFIVTILPLYYTWVVHKHPIFPRLNSVTGNRLNQFLLQLARTDQPLYTLWQHFDSNLLGIVHLPDQSTFYGGETAMILPLLVPFFLMGVGLLIWRIRSISGSLLIGWLAMGIFANGLIGVLVQSPRYVVIHPAIAIVLAFGMEATWRIMFAHPQISSSKWRNRFAIIILVGIVGYQVGYFFTVHLPNYYFQYFYHEVDPFRNVRIKDFDDMLFRLNTLPDNTQVYVISAGSGDINHFTTYITYIGRAHTLAINHVFPHEVNEAWLFSLRYHPQNYAFFLEPEDGQTFNLLHDSFQLTEGQFSPFEIPHERQFVLYIAPLIWNFQPIAPSEIE